MNTLNLLDTTAPFNPALIDKATVNEARDLYNRSVATMAEPHNAPTQLGDDAIWAHVVKYRSQYPTADNSECVKDVVKRMWEAKDADNGPVQAEVNTHDARILAALDVLNNDNEFNAIVTDAVEARTIIRNVGREFTRILFADFCTVEVDGKRIPWTREHVTKPFDMGVMNEWPEPGLVQSDKITKPNTGWDVERKPVNGKTVPVGWYRTMVEGFAIGKAIREEIEELGKALQSPPSGKYKDNNSKEYIEGEIDALRLKINDVAEWLRDAVRLIRQIHAVNELGHVRAFLVVNRNRMTDGTTRLEFTEAPNKIVVQETHDGGERWPCTIAQFMKFSPKIAATKGGTLSALRESAKPDTTGNGTAAGQGNTTQAIEPWTLPTFAAQAEKFGQFMSNDALVTALAQRINDRDETKSDAILKGLLDVYITVGAMFAGHPVWVARAEKLGELGTGTLASMLDPTKLKKAS